MKKLLVIASSVFLALSAGGVLAQAPAATPAHRHAEGLQMERQGNDKAAFVAFLEAAEGGHAPAQRRVAEIYDSGNHAVERDFGESIRWYEKARQGGEKIPPPKSPVPSFTTGPN